MATFVMTGKYTAGSVKDISSDRTATANEIAEKCGGKITAAYATMGQSDLLFITEFPGVGEAIQASVALNKALGIAFSTTPALAVADFDKLIG